MAAPSDVSWLMSAFEKSNVGTPVKMAAPISNVSNDVVIISDEDDELQMSAASGLVQSSRGRVGFYGQRCGRFMQWIPRVVSPMLHRVQSWEVGNQAFLQLGEQIELVDNSGAVSKGTVCGEASSTGAVGRAYVSLDFWQPDSGEGPTGCGTSHASSGHGVQASHQRSGQMVGDQSFQVKVRAPSEHRPEWRVKPGAVYPTSGESAGVDNAQPSTSQGAGAGWASMEEDLLDYEDDMEEPVMPRQWVVMAGDVPGVVQGGHSKVHHRDMSAGSLQRGKDGLVGSMRVNELRENFGNLSRSGALTVMGGSREQRMGKVDASIQVSSVTEVDGKLEVSGGNVDGSVQKAESSEGGTTATSVNTGGDGVGGWD
ncbi:hypothetical protein NDU88_008793 [Pleurodeles waltl]|uniref:Uncharacterized protein n=1 Tax=Pleurodeles waltl TaxID=8319 RepID=A0AAV7QRR2_PLEWA|nr:hypothetical protein NDU88_008793 [Pleurodeles waltl]